jgi:hypothetical protein
MENFKPLLGTVLPIVTLLIGLLFGLFSSLLLERMRRKQLFLSKIFDQYLKVREEITESLGNLHVLVTQIDKTPDYNILMEYRDKVSGLYFKHYDLLPGEVLMELICLYACITKQGKNIYRCDDKLRIVPMNINNKMELREFVEKISLVKNLKIYAPNVLNSSNKEIKASLIINMQAWSVAAALNKYFGLNEIMSWGKHLRKIPIREQNTLLINNKI